MTERPADRGSQRPGSRGARSRPGRAVAPVGRGTTPGGPHENATGFAPISAGLSWALLIGSAVTIGVVVFLLPTERLSRGYDWFQVWRFHKEFLRTTLWQQGVVPLWCRWSFAGRPFLADMQTQIFYPGSLLYVLLPPSLALPADVLAHEALAAAGMFLFCRARAATRWAALLAAIAWAGCGFAIAHTTAGHIQYYAAAAWVPFVFLAIERWLETRAPAWVAAGAASIALQFFAGAPMVSWMTLSFGALYAAGRLLECWRAGEGAKGKQLAVVAAGLAGLFALGLIGAAAEMMPAWEFAAQSVRAGRGFDYAASDALPAKELLHLLVPATLGQELAWEFYGYFGLLPLALAIVALVSGGWRRGGAVLGLLAALALVLMLGAATPFFGLLCVVMPGVTLFRTHAREVCLFSFCLITLGAEGLSRIEGPAGLDRARLAGRVAGGALLATAAIGALAVLSLPTGRNPGIAGGLWAAAVAGGGVVLWRSARPFRWSGPVLAALLVVELLSAESSVRDRLTIRTAAPVGQADLERVLRDEPSDARFWFPRSRLLSNEGYALRKSAVEGYENLLLARYQAYIHAMTGAPLKPGVITILTQSNFTAAPSPFPFKALDVKYAVIPGKDGSYPVSVNPDPPGPAFLPGRAEVLSEALILDRMREPGWDPRRVALVEGAPEGWTGGDEGPAGTVTVVHENPNRIRAQVDAARPAILILSEIDYPGWTVSVDGKAARGLRGDYLLRGVALAAGRHEVLFTFAPASLRHGLLASAVAGAACLALVALPRARRAARAGRVG